MNKKKIEKRIKRFLLNTLNGIKFLLKLIAYIILWLGYKWKWLVSFLYIAVCYILNITILQHEIVYKILNNDYVKAFTFNQFYKNIYVPIYFIELVIMILLLAWLKNNCKLKVDLCQVFRHIFLKDSNNRI